MNQISNENLIFIIITIIWVLPWKAYSVWTASKRNEKGWFIALVMLNTFGILEIFYIFFIAKKKWSDIQGVLKRVLSRNK